MKQASAILLILTVCLMSPLKVTAQDETVKKKEPKVAIMLVPQYAWIKTFRMDFGFKIGNNDIVIGPHYQYSNESVWFTNSQYDEITAVGANIYFKYNLRQGDFKVNPYMSFGGLYSHSNIVLTDDVWKPYDYQGVDAITFTGETKNISIHKFGPDILFGVAFHPIPEMVIDLSAGIGARFSSSDENQDLVKEKFSDGILDPGYKGILPIIAFKIGLRI